MNYLSTSLNGLSYCSADLCISYVAFLNIDDMKNIIKYTKKILKKAIKKGGSTIKDFKNTKGLSGNYQKEFKVYNRENLKCLRSKCSGFIKKIIINNRSTFYCNNCQK